MYIRFNQVSKSYEDQPVLREVFFRLSDGDRLGLIGKNGAGKTTFLKLILGLETPDTGSVDLEPGMKLGYFSQFSELQGERSILALLDDVFRDVHAIQSELSRIEHALDAGPGLDELDRLLQRQTDLIAEMEQRDGWNYQYKIETVLSRLGFNEQHRSCPIDALSGGWRNRAALSKIVLEAPDVLLMDEPTNYLDLEGLSAG